MKNLLTYLILLIIAAGCGGDTNIETNVKLPIHASDLDYELDTVTNTEIGLVYNIVDSLPEFGVGEDDLIKYFQENIKYPQSAINGKIQGRVYIKVIIKKDGSVFSPKIKRGIQSEIDSLCLQVVQNMPRWKPAKQKNEYVNSSYIIPIIFSLEDNNELKGIVINN